MNGRMSKTTNKKNEQEEVVCREQNFLKIIFCLRSFLLNVVLIVLTKLAFHFRLIIISFVISQRFLIQNQLY